MASVELFFALLELGLLFCDLLLEDHLHLGLHLGELGLVQCTVLCELDGGVDFLEDGVVLDDTHRGELLRSPVFVKDIVGVLPELFHVCPDEHLSELDKVAVILIVDLNDTPWVRSSSDGASVNSLDLPVRADDGKGHLGGNLFVFGNGLFVIIVVDGGLEDLDLVVGNVVEDTLLELDNLFVGEGISFGDDGDEVDTGVQSAHEFDVNVLQGVAGGLDKVDAGMDSVVRDFLAVELVLLREVRVEAGLDVIEDRLPAFIVVDKVAETGGVDDGEAESDAIFLNVGTDALDGDRLGPFRAWGEDLLWGVERGIEEGVDECRLS